MLFAATSYMYYNMYDPQGIHAMYLVRSLIGRVSTLSKFGPVKAALTACFYNFMFISCSVNIVPAASTDR